MNQEKRVHLGVYGLIKNGNKILCIKKTRGPYTGKYDFPGGKLEHGETVLEGLAREIKEEVNLEIKESKFIENVAVTLSFVEGNSEIYLLHVGMVYEVIPTSLEIQQIHAEDVGGSEWIELENLNQNNLSPIGYQIVKKYQ